MADHTVLILETDDCHRTYESLQDQGVSFREEPSDAAWGTEATLEDPAGNVLGLFEPNRML